VVGAGPAGLSAAHELAMRGAVVAVYEQNDRVGGLARTVTYQGYRFDIGGHRFLTKVPEVQRLWEHVMGSEFISVNRLSRIYYRRRFFDYPITIPNVVRNLGPWESFLLAASYVRAKLLPLGEETTLEQWVTNRFGSRLYRTFFSAYTEKVWGIPGSEVRADWAVQRIKGLSVRAALRQALLGNSKVKTLTREFLYPRLGVGQMWERLADLVVAAGGTVHLESEVTELHHDGSRVVSLDVMHRGHTTTVPASEVITSIPLVSLLERLDPPPPAEVLEAVRGLRYRDYIMVGLIVETPRAFPDNWIYVHSPAVHVGRIQNFGNWSAAMVPDEGRTSLGMEYFCSVGDNLWSMSDEALRDLAVRELHELGLASPTQVVDGCVVRQPKAYPVYDDTYRRRVEVVRSYLSRFSNLQTVGRNGTHRYNNLDHSTLAGLFAARNILGEQHDIWNINTDASYLEEHPDNA
jgi:protoporphyrinogen oxidase